MMQPGVVDMPQDPVDLIALLVISGSAVALRLVAG